MNRRPEGIYCPACDDMTSLDGLGRCLYCYAPVLNGKRPQRATKKGPSALRISAPLIREAYELYVSGLSLRRVTEAIFDRTTYASHASCSNGIWWQFKQHGWPLRDRITALRGVTDASRCQGANRRHRSRRCPRPAQLGGTYCHAHDPARSAERHAHMNRVRPKR